MWIFSSVRAYQRNVKLSAAHEPSDCSELDLCFDPKTAFEKSQFKFNELLGLFFFSPRIFSQGVMFLNFSPFLFTCV